MLRYRRETLFTACDFLRHRCLAQNVAMRALDVPMRARSAAAILIGQYSVTVVLAWAALKMRQFTRYKVYMGITILCGVIFLAVKLAYE